MKTNSEPCQSNQLKVKSRTTECHEQPIKQELNTEHSDQNKMWRLKERSINQITSKVNFITWSTLKTSLAICWLEGLEIVLSFKLNIYTVSFQETYPSMPQDICQNNTWQKIHSNHVESQCQHWSMAASMKRTTQTDKLARLRQGWYQGQKLINK